VRVFVLRLFVWSYYKVLFEEQRSHLRVCVRIFLSVFMNFLPLSVCQMTDVGCVLQFVAVRYSVLQYMFVCLCHVLRHTRLCRVLCVILRGCVIYLVSGRACVCVIDCVCLNCLCHRLCVLEL